MKRWIWIGVGFVALVLISAGVWGYGYIRRVDGRSPSQWLTYADQASQMVAYHAEGRSSYHGTHATFILDQGTNGRYVLTTRDAQGRFCSLGYDGKQIWYSTEMKKEKISVPQAPETPIPDRARILGTATVAGRPVVRLAASNGRVEKVLAIDRHTGIVLALTTRMRHHVLSDMVINRIMYRTTDVPSCAEECRERARTVDRATLEAHLGSNLVEPHWLPEGFVRTEMLLEPCGECGKPMGVLRYADGISAITLFEMPRHTMMCGMGEECQQSGDGRALVVEKTIGPFAVTAVGTVDKQTLRRVLDSTH